MACCRKRAAGIKTLPYALLEVSSPSCASTIHTSSTCTRHAHAAKGLLQEDGRDTQSSCRPALRSRDRRANARNTRRIPGRDSPDAPRPDRPDVADHARAAPERPCNWRELDELGGCGGAWVQHALREEWDLRSNALSGLDQLWLLLSPPEVGGLASNDGARSKRRGYGFVPTCAATYIFEGDEPVTYEAVREAVDRQAEAFSRYKSILTNLNRRFHGAVFVEDPNWSIDRHIETVELPKGSGQVELEAFIADFISRAWDFNKPLWECAIVSGFYSEDSGASSALISRGHHALADGQGFVMSQLLSTSFGPELRVKLEDGQQLLHDARRGRAKPSKLHPSLKPLDRYRNYIIVQLLLLFAFWVVFAVTQLLELTGTIRQSFVTSTYFLLTCWRQLYLTSEYSGPRVQEKEFAVSPHFPMSDVKKIQRAFSGAKPGSWLDRAAKRGQFKNKTPYRHLTLNDVMCTVIADVLAAEARHQQPSSEARRSVLYWLKAASHWVLPSPISLFIPISIRPLTTKRTMENWSTGSIAYLPSPLKFNGNLRAETDIQGLYEVLHTNADALKVVKRGWVPTAIFYLTQITGQLPSLYPATWQSWPAQPIVRFFVQLSLSSFHAVLTNVPGPEEAVKLADRRVSQWGAAPPQAGKNTLAIELITYNGDISVTFTADRVRGEPSEGVARRLAEAFADRWEAYVRAADAVLS
ncbi:hypothetical protein V8E36_003306 [Tilletia maclaganii]